MKLLESISVGVESHPGNGCGDHRVSWQELPEVYTLQIGARHRQACDHRSDHGFGGTKTKGDGDGGDSRGKKQWNEPSKRFSDSPQIESRQIWEYGFLV